MTRKTATIESYHVWGTRGHYYARLTYRGYTLADRPHNGRDDMRELWRIAQAQGFTHALYEDQRGRRPAVPLNWFYDSYCN